MDVATKGALVLRKTAKEPKGLVVVTQPLSNLMNEKLRGSVGRVAVLSMGQDMTMVQKEREGCFMTRPSSSSYNRRWEKEEESRIGGWNTPNMIYNGHLKC